MTGAQPRFKYPLIALQALYAHRLEQMRLLLVTAQHRLMEHQHRIELMRADLNRAHADWIGVSRQTERFDPARFGHVREALGTRHASLTHALNIERELLVEVERCRELVARAHRRTETVERHKEQSMREFAQEAVRIDQRLADAAWPVKGESP